MCKKLSLRKCTHEILDFASVNNFGEVYMYIPINNLYFVS